LERVRGGEERGGEERRGEGRRGWGAMIFMSGWFEVWTDSVWTFFSGKVSPSTIQNL
jgi:hypothetical protein